MEQFIKTPDRQVTFSADLSVSQRRPISRARYGSAPEIGNISAERSRATSGSEVGLELDPSRAKAIEVGMMYCFSCYGLNCNFAPVDSTGLWLYWMGSYLCRVGWLYSLGISTRVSSGTQ